MTQENLFMETDGLRGFAQTHADVVSGVSGLLGSTAQATGVELTHGPIASAVHAALGGALDARQGSIQGAVNVGRHLSESLQAAAHAYDQADQGSAARLGAAGEATGGPGGPGQGAPGGGKGSGAGASQMLGQLGQMGGQLAQALAGLFQGGPQALGQLAQPLLQGVQQSVQQAGQLAQQHGEHAAGDVEMVSENRDEAAPGENTPAGRAPTERVTLASETSPKTGTTPL